jgi:hypothetical protein
VISFVFSSLIINEFFKHVTGCITYETTISYYIWSTDTVVSFSHELLSFLNLSNISILLLPKSSRNRQPGEKSRQLYVIG